MYVYIYVCVHSQEMLVGTTIAGHGPCCAVSPHCWLLQPVVAAPRCSRSDPSKSQEPGADADWPEMGYVMLRDPAVSCSFIAKLA